MSHNLRSRLLAAMCGLLVATSVGTAQGQDATSGPVRKPAMRLYNDAGSAVSAAAPHLLNAAELRQARAWKQQQNREARIEAAKNAGYHLSRPPAVAVPSMTSRYQCVRPWYFPVYVYPRY